MRNTAPPADRFGDILERLSALAEDEMTGRVPRTHHPGALARDTPEGRFRIAAVISALERSKGAA